MPEKLYPDNLVRYVYDETSVEENILLESIIFENEQLEESFFELLHLKRELDSIICSPSEKSVSKILEFSKSFNTESIL